MQKGVEPRPGPPTPLSTGRSAWASKRGSEWPPLRRTSQVTFLSRHTRGAQAPPAPTPAPTPSLGPTPPRRPDALKPWLPPWPWLRPLPTRPGTCSLSWRGAAAPRAAAPAPAAGPSIGSVRARSAVGGPLCSPKWMHTWQRHGVGRAGRTHIAQADTQEWSAVHQWDQQETSCACRHRFKSPQCTCAPAHTSLRPGPCQPPPTPHWTALPCLRPPILYLILLFYLIAPTHLRMSSRQ